MTKTVNRMLIIALCVLVAVIAGVTFASYGTDNAYASDTPSVTAPTFEVTGGQATSDGEKSYSNLFDDDTNSKYCIEITRNPYVTVRASDVATVVTGYTLYTGNDTSTHAGRNPKSWTLYGSNNGIDWTPIHQVTDDETMGTDDETGYPFTFENTTPYWHYKFAITNRRGGIAAESNESSDWNFVQISEIKFTASIADAVEVDTEAELASAFENGGKAKLVGDIALTSDLSLSLKTLEIDLNGHVISGHKLSVMGASSISHSILILKDSNPSATHTDTTLPAGGVVASELSLTRNSEDQTWDNKAYLYANGGTVVQQLKIDTGSAQIDYYGDTMTLFKAGVHGAGATINAGFYYGSVVSTNTDRPYTTSNKKVEFKVGDTVYATQYLRSGDKAMCPADPTVEGYTFIKWYNGATNNYHDFASAVTSNLTLKAMLMKEVGTFADLKTEISGGNSVKLTADITMTSDFSISSGKYITIDLNGHVIYGNNKQIYGTGCGGTETPGPATNLTIIDSNPSATHTDTSLPIGGYIKTTISVTASSTTQDTGFFNLHANGGTIQKVHCPSFACFIIWSDGTPSVIESVTGSSGGANPTSKGGLYYYDRALDANSIKVTYKDGDDVYAVLGMSNETATKKAVEPKEPAKKAGYVFDGWYNGDTKYDFSTPVTASLTLSAHWTQDNTNPEISGLLGNSHYCNTDLEVTVTDANLDKVTVNGVEVELTADGKFTIPQSTETDKVVIVATDKALNSTTRTVPAHYFGSIWTSAVPNTCTSSGNYAYHSCGYCNTYQYIADLSVTDYNAYASSENHPNLLTCAYDEKSTKINLVACHVWGDIVQAQAPTCTEGGWHPYRQCTRTECGKYQVAIKTYDTVDANYFDTAPSSDIPLRTSAEDANVNALDHKFTKHERDYVNSTCTSEGNYDYYSCERCNGAYQYYIAGTEYTCSTSQEDYDKYIAIPKKEHQYGTLIPEVPASCVATGVAKHYKCSDCHNLFDENKVQKTDSDLTLAVDPDNHKYATSCSKKCINTGCTHERTDSERVHVFDTNGSACIYNNNYAQHAYFCTNDNCSDGIMYEDHTMVLVCGQTGTGNAWQHWEECSKTGCVYETAKTDCTIKYESRSDDVHAMYCEVDGVKHNFGANNQETFGNHDWSSSYVFDSAKFEADGSCYHAHNCKDCGALTDEEECTSVYNHDGNGHWQECDYCPHKFTTSEAHTYVMCYDADYHWEKCSACRRGYTPSEHTFESATSTSCSEEDCGYQRFLKATISSINGYAIDAPVGGLTSSGKTDRTDVNLTLSKYLLYDSNMTRIFFETTNANMTFRPNMPYYAILSFNCGKVYPANDMKADDFTLPQGYEFGYYDIDVDDDTNDVILEVFVTLPALGGVSTTVAVSEMQIDIKNFEVGKTFGDLVIAITCKGLPKDKSFVIYDMYGNDINGSFVTNETMINNTAYSLIITLTAPDGFTFYGLTDSDITVKNDLGIVYIAPTSEGKVSKDGKCVQICVVINALVPEHVCGDDGWDIIEWYYDYLCPDKTTQHTKMCKICGAVEFVNHVYDNDEDTICDECEYQRTLKLNEMRFTLTGYQSDALLKDIQMTYGGSKYASEIHISGGIVDLQEGSYLWPDTATFVPGKVYGLMVYVLFKQAIDITDCMFDNVYVNNTKVDVITAYASEDLAYYVVYLPAVTGESTQTKLEDVELKASGFTHGASLSGTSFKVNHPGIEKISAQVSENDNSMSDSQSFALGNTYILSVMYTLSDGYYGNGITADDLKVSLYDDVNADSPTKIADFTCVYMFIEDIGYENNKRMILCEYLVQLAVPENTEGHQDGHVFPTENQQYFTDENMHYVLCECGAYDEGQAHVYGEDFAHIVKCSVCGYERVYSIEKVEITVDCSVGTEANDLNHSAELYFDGIHADGSLPSNFPDESAFYISEVGLYEGALTNATDILNRITSRLVLADTAYTLSVILDCYDGYFDISALEASDYTLKGIGETAIQCSDVSYYNDGRMTILIFHIPAMQAQHIHGGAWIDEVPATCTDAGTKGHYVCTVCGDNFDEENVKIDDLTINALGHDYDVTYTWSADNSECTANGVCKHDSNHTINGTATVTPSISQNKTCLLDELTTYTATFTNSGLATQTKENVKTADALGHNQDGEVAHVYAKCTETGVVGGTYCTRCNHGKADAEATINALGHDMTHQDREDATSTATGTIEHWSCANCNKNFADQDGNSVLDSIVIAKLAPSVVEGSQAQHVKGVDGGLSIKLDALKEDFESVYVDGEQVDASNYTIGESGLEIIFNANYLASLADGEHSVEINCLGGKATSAFTVMPTPQSGLSGGAIAGIVIACVVFVAIATFAILWFLVKKKSFADIANLFKRR